MILILLTFVSQKTSSFSALVGGKTQSELVVPPCPSSHRTRHWRWAPSVISAPEDRHSTNGMPMSPMWVFHILFSPIITTLNFLPVLFLNNSFSLVFWVVQKLWDPLDMVLLVYNVLQVSAFEEFYYLFSTWQLTKMSFGPSKLLYPP